MSGLHVAPEDLRTEDPRSTGLSLSTVDLAIATVRGHCADPEDVLEALGLLDEVLS
jgi:hypothetical protein